MISFTLAAALTATAVAFSDLPRSAADVLALPYVQHHSLIPPFLSTPWPAAEHFWEFGGDTVIEDHRVRLTPDKQSRQGFLWNTERNDLSSWEANFGIHAFSNLPLGGDGLAFWYRDTHPRLGLKEGENGPLLGASTNFKGLGVMFDTYDNDGNDDNPKVVVIYNQQSKPAEFDPSRDFNTDQQDDDTVREASCKFGFRNQPAEGETTVRVRFSPEHTLEVFLQHAGNVVLCASFENLKLPVGYHFGFTGETGGVADKHDVTFLHVASLSGDSAEVYDKNRFDKDHEGEEKEYWAFHPQKKQQHEEPNLIHKL